jgi:hypothetical protein
MPGQGHAARAMDVQAAKPESMLHGIRNLPACSGGWLQCA